VASELFNELLFDDIIQETWRFLFLFLFFLIIRVLGTYYFVPRDRTLDLILYEAPKLNDFPMESTYPFKLKPS
jgi:hypothetical protein